MVQSQIVQDLGLDIPKTVFAFARKKLTNRTAQSLLNDVVRIDEWQAQSTGQLPSNGGFA
jgi:hypothetical protein